jgi:glycosyltransferase involved in cell wall biosynthesis
MARCSSGCLATTVPDHRVRIGIWAVSDGSGLWIADHVPRLVGGLVEGAALGGTMTFCICVSPSDHAAARQMLLELAAREGVDWTLTKVGWDIRHPVAVFTAWLLRRTPRLGRWALFSMLLVLLPLRLLGSLLRPLWGFLYRNGLSTVPGLLQDLRLAWHDPIAAAAAIAPILERHRLGPAQRLGRTLRSWAATLGANKGTAAAPSLPPPANAPRRVRPANTRQLPETDGWLLLDPGEVTVLQVPGRRVALLLNLIPFDFPFSLDTAGWHPDGRWDRWKRVASETLETVDAVITGSLDVADRPAAGLFNISPAKLTTISPAVPDLWPLLPCRPADRVPTYESRRSAGCVLRKHALEHGWPYLMDFPFEDVPYIFVVAQDCPIQNVSLAAEAVRLLLRREYFDIKLFTTARLELGPASRMVREAALQFEVLSVPGLPPAAYAAFYHCATMAVYPSYAEEGLAATRFAESVSLGTPCLMAAGPESRKLLGHESGLLPFLFDPYDAEALARLIRQIAMDRPSAFAAQSAMLERLPRRSWGDVAERYATIVSGRPIGAAAQAGA